MAWSDRHQAMLAEMGLRMWLPPGTADVAGAADPTTETAPAAEPATATRSTTTPAPIPGAGPAVIAPPPADRPVLARAPEAATAAPADAATGAAAHLDWPALRAAVAGCQACGLCRTRRQTVFGVGHLQAQLMIVGEAPGEQEDAQGEPFVGAAGQLLDRMLAALGLGRGEGTPDRQVFIANTLKCRPPRNRNPAPEELAACQPFLERQVALVGPQVILAMGRFAVQQLLGTDDAIGKLRGQVHRWRGVPVVVSYHPAYLLRQPADKAKAWDDLCRVADLLRLPAR